MPALFHWDRDCCKPAAKTSSAANGGVTLFKSKPMCCQLNMIKPPFVDWFMVKFPPVGFQETMWNPSNLQIPSTSWFTQMDKWNMFFSKSTESTVHSPTFFVHRFVHWNYVKNPCDSSISFHGRPWTSAFVWSWTQMFGTPREALHVYDIFYAPGT